MTINVAVIDYGAGNLKSVTKAITHICPEAQVMLATMPQQIAMASHIILPGVGAFADCMQGLQALTGMIEALEERVLQEHVPFLGICVGMQMLFETGHEHGTHKGLGWVKGEVLPLKPDNKFLKVPHMGWNELEIQKSHPLLEGIRSGDHVYYVHSYYCAAQHEDVVATTNYGAKVTAAVARNNVMGVQFHPEKSQQTGLLLFRNFLQLGASCLIAPKESPR